ncbi:MAG: hypothetical protein P9M14_08100 [Candidatus Alcyoniella australis]|nr:hypothetical protein [Candidatus Alcyoniella australis]
MRVRVAHAQTHSAGDLHRIPLRFTIEDEQREYLVSKVLGSWIERDEGGVERRKFRVDTDCGLRALLIYDATADCWTVEI